MFSADHARFIESCRPAFEERNNYPTGKAKPYIQPFDLGEIYSSFKKGDFEKDTINYIVLKDNQSANIRLLPGLKVDTLKKFYPHCPCCEKAGAKGHIRYRAEVVDIADGGIKRWEFGSSIKQQISGIVKNSLENTVRMNLVKVGKIVLGLFSNNATTSIDLLVERHRGGNDRFPTYRVKRV